jgi:hypothetical protein
MSFSSNLPMTMKREFLMMLMVLIGKVTWKYTVRFRTCPISRLAARQLKPKIDPKSENQPN